MNAQFLLMHFNRICDAPGAIPRLRQFVLELAVRGKLVSQHAKDEPAASLLERIKSEKAARFSQLLVELQTGPFGSSLHESDYQKGGVPVINPASIKNGKLVPLDNMAVGIATLQRLSTFKLRKGDIVMARRGEMGRCAVVTEREDGWLCGTGSLILRLPDCLFPPFLVTLIGSPFVREYLGGSAVGATMQNLNQSILLNLVVGLPPLAEQHRIVATVDELMAVCDRMEMQLATTQNEKRKLLESVLHHALNGGRHDTKEELEL